MSFGLNVIITSIEFTLFYLTKSAALLAEAVHSLTDVIGILFVIVGIYLSEKKSEKFPWGLYKIENLAAILVGILIFISAYEIGKMVYKPAPAGMKNVDIALIILFSMAFPIILFSRYEAKKAKMLNSPSLMADAKSWMMDIAPLAIVAVGIVGAKFSYPIIDRIAAGAIMIIVVRAGYGIVRDSVKSLLDASVDKATLEKMRSVVKQFSEVKGITSLQARSSGRFIFVYINLSLSLKRLRAAHEITNNIEREIKSRIPFVERVIIHYEPERKEYQRYAVPLGNREGDISEHFGRAPFIALWDKRNSDALVLSQEIVENPFVKMEKGKGMKLAEFLVEKGIDILYTRERFDGRGPEYVFSEAEVEVKKTDIKKLSELINME